MIHIRISRKHIIFSSLLIFLIVGILFFGHKYFKVVSVNGKIFITELALTPKEQEKGLGERKDLCERCAMLFYFKTKDIYLFWMKDMNFDLDIIWILDNEIAYIEKNVSHQSLEKIDPKIKADKVFEINAGLSEKFNFKIGDRINIY